MIRFDNWTIQADGDILARQFDNLTRTLTVTGDIPAGWEWVVLVQAGEAMDIIPLTAADGALSAVLTAQQLSIAGYYQMQLRATQVDKVQHTNMVNVYIPASLSGDEQWPTVPSEFTEMERRISEKAAEVEGYAYHPHVVGENGNWWAWNGEAYVDTGKPSRGEKGTDGPQGAPGYTPQKGVDYWTEADTQSIISQTNTLYANALKGTASGETVRMEDVSPLEHTVPVKVSGVDDPTSVTVYAHGKNLYNNVDYGLINPPTSVVFTATKTETGYSVTGTSGNTNWFLIPLCSLAELGGKSVTLSADISGTPTAPNLVICDKDYGNRKVLYGGTFDGRAISFSVPQASAYPDGYIVTVRLNGDKNNDPAAVATYDNIQVEIGTTATEYEPYKPSVEYMPNEDGTCEVASIAPTMTLLTDTTGAVMECEYNRDINKAFDQLVQAIISMGGNI